MTDKNQPKDAGVQPAPALQPEALRIAMHLRQRAQLSRPGNLDTLSAAGANELERQHAELSTVQAEAMHWRSNHDNVVARLRIFTQRPDIPKEQADRLPWYRELVRLQAVEAQALQQSAEITDAEIDRIAESMPGGLDGFPKAWRWRQFARAILQAAPPAQPETIQALRALHDSVDLAIQRGALSDRALEMIVMQPATDVLSRATPQAAPAAPPAIAAVAVPADLATFEGWWRQEQLKTFPKEYDIAELPRWGLAFKQHALDAWNAHAAIAAAPAQEHATQLAGQASTRRQWIDGERTLKQEVLGAIHDYSRTKPEDDPEDPESWESWFQAAFDLLGSRVGDIFEERTASDQAQGCTRSHPHENMSPMCVLRTEIARLNHAAAIAQATAAPAQAQEDARKPIEPQRPAGMTSVNARLSFNHGWLSCERAHGIRAAQGGA